VATVVVVLGPPVMLWAGGLSQTIPGTAMAEVFVMVPLATGTGLLVGLTLDQPVRHGARRLGLATALLSAALAATAWGAASFANVASDTCSGAIPDRRCYDPNSSYPLPEAARFVLPLVPAMGAAGGGLGSIVVIGLVVGSRLAHRSGTA
jgi:hypothetical protein